MVYLRLTAMGYQRMVEYRWGHMVNNLASLIFGFIYISVWQAAAPAAAPPGGYTAGLMTKYIALTQAGMWLCLFGMGTGLGIPQAVRTGTVALEMARPLGFFGYTISREAGTVAYNLLYRSLPMAALFTLVVGSLGPAGGMPALAGAAAMVIAAYVGLCVAYLIGLSAFWTTETRWLHWLYMTANTLLSGGWVPVDLLPGWLGQAAPFFPFAAMLYHPLRLYLGLEGPEWLAVPATWAVALTGICLGLTRLARRKLVIQGG